MPTLQKYFEILFPNLSLPFSWKDIYILPRIVTTNTRLHIFQYKLLNNAFYLKGYTNEDLKSTDIFVFK